MRFHDIIVETPLPPDWDSSVYTPASSYKQRIDYAVKRAQKMGTGSSRVAFVIEYQGRKTILKVAKNKKGMAQNEAEAALLSDGYLSQMDIAIPIIDYDEQHSQPVWIHTEMAQKATEKQLCSLMKCRKLFDLVYHANGIASGKNMGQFQRDYQSKMSEDDFETFLSYSDKLTDLANSFDINISDFARAANWGLFNGEPVVIDLGFTEDVRKNHYS